MAKIVIADDEAGLRTLFEMVLIRAGHEVVGSFASVEGTLAKLPELLAAGCNAALIDGNMVRKDDGAVLAQKLEEAIPGIWIVSATADPNPKTWGKVNLSKPMFAANLSAAFAGH